MSSLPKKVKLVEVGPRDGLQNEPAPIPVDLKVGLINRLSDAGLPVIEAGAFVSPKWVQQMADTDKVFKQIDRKKGTLYPALVPNEKGMEDAIAAGVTEVAIFTAASETFNKKNTNATIAEAYKRFEPVMKLAKDKGINVRGYVSTAVECPYEGAVAPKAVAEVTKELLNMGCYEISLGDTIGTATPNKVTALLDACFKVAKPEQLAVHFHDTYGQAIANIHTSLQTGISTVDASVGGLGGCPYAPGAAGNVATEDVVYLLDGLGINHGINLQELVNAAWFISQKLLRQPASKVARAMGPHYADITP